MARCWSPTRAPPRHHRRAAVPDVAHMPTAAGPLRRIQSLKLDGAVYASPLVVHVAVKTFP